MEIWREEKVFLIGVVSEEEVKRQLIFSYAGFGGKIQEIKMSSNPEFRYEARVLLPVVRDVK